MSLNPCSCGAIPSSISTMHDASRPYEEGQWWCECDNCNKIMDYACTRSMAQQIWNSDKTHLEIVQEILREETIMNDNQNLHDTGDRTDPAGTGALRDMPTGKGRCDLLPAVSILRLARHYENGARKYSDRNWEKGLPISSFMDSAIRHLMKYLDGQADEDHLAAAAWNVLGAMWTETKKPELQDIPTRLDLIDTGEDLWADGMKWAHIPSIAKYKCTGCGQELTENEVREDRPVCLFCRSFVIPINRKEEQS